MTENFLQSKCREFLEAKKRAKTLQTEQRPEQLSPRHRRSPRSSSAWSSTRSLDDRASWQSHKNLKSRSKQCLNLPSPELDVASIDAVEGSLSAATSCAAFSPTGRNNEFDLAQRSRSSSSSNSTSSFNTARRSLRSSSNDRDDVDIFNNSGLVTTITPATPVPSDNEEQRDNNGASSQWLWPDYQPLEFVEEKTTTTTTPPTKASKVKLKVKIFKHKVERKMAEKWAKVKARNKSPGAASDTSLSSIVASKKKADIDSSIVKMIIADRTYSSDSEVNSAGSTIKADVGDRRRRRKSKKRAGSPRAAVAAAGADKGNELNASPRSPLLPRDNDKDEESKDPMNSSVTSLVPSDAASESLNDSSVVDLDSASLLEEREDLRLDSPDILYWFRTNFNDTVAFVKRYFQKGRSQADANRRLKSQIWTSVVTIILVRANNLMPMNVEGTSDAYVKFRLGAEKYKSKVIYRTLNPEWLEQFDLHLYEECKELELTVWDRDKSRHQDALMGRVLINLEEFKREETHRCWYDLEDGVGRIYLLLTISGTTASETISDLTTHGQTPQEEQQLLQKYSLANTFQRFRDVGHLTVKVDRAQGLVAADLGGKSDPFCVLELVNSRLQTQTEYKTLTPNWKKIFTFNVKDINSVLEVTVYDEDRDHKVEFLGKVAIPLLRVKNGLKRWYALKDKKLRCRAKGNSPQILLEMNVVWNAVRASYRTLNPKEKKFMEPETKFKRQIFIRNVVRLKSVIMWFYDCGKYMQSCWEWEYKMRSSIALVLFVVGTYYFEPWMIPTAAFLIIFYYYLIKEKGTRKKEERVKKRSVCYKLWSLLCKQVTVFTGVPLSNQMSVQLHDSADGNEDGPPTPGEDDEDDDKEEKKSLRETFQAIQEVTQTVQNSMGYLASLCERVKNLFNFTVPYLSCLAMLLAVCAAIIFFLIPLRYLILLWGINKFTKKIIRPHSVPNSELLDLISRVPDDEELLNYRELRASPTADGEGRDGAASPSSPTGTLQPRRRRTQQQKQQAQSQTQA